MRNSELGVRGLVCAVSRFYWNVWRSFYARRCVSIAMFCVRLTPAVCRIASNRTACAALRFYRRVWRSITPVFFPLSGKKKRLAMCCVLIPAWVGIAFCAFSSVSMVIGLCWLTLGLCVFCRRFRRRTRERLESAYTKRNAVLRWRSF